MVGKDILCYNILQPTLRRAGDTHLLRSADVDRFLQTFLLVEVLEKVQGVMRLTHDCSIFRRWFSFGDDFKINAVLGIVGTCFGTTSALLLPQLGGMESLEEVPKFVDC